MNKLIWSLVPACFSFGPLFLTRINGSARPESAHFLETAGLIMLTFGLLVTFRVITRQQREIAELRESLTADRRPISS
jgi:hypothetical protein